MMEIWKRFKEMGPRRLRGERGFTLIEMLIVMVIIAILLGGVIYAIGGFGGGAESTSYSLHKSTVENACLDYWVVNDYEYPAFDTNGVYYGNQTYTAYDPLSEEHECWMIDLCLLASLGYFEVVPSSAVSLAGDDNCDGSQVSCSDCSSTAHYVFYWDNTDECVVSLCVNVGTASACTATDADGYQDVFP